MWQLVQYNPRPLNKYLFQKSVEATLLHRPNIQRKLPEQTTA